MANSNRKGVTNLIFDDGHWLSKTREKNSQKITSKIHQGPTKSKLRRRKKKKRFRKFYSGNKRHLRAFVLVSEISCFSFFSALPTWNCFFPILNVSRSDRIHFLRRLLQKLFDFLSILLSMARKLNLKKKLTF